MQCAYLDYDQIPRLGDLWEIIIISEGNEFVCGIWVIYRHV